MFFFLRGAGKSYKSSNKQKDKFSAENGTFSNVNHYTEFWWDTWLCISKYQTEARAML